MNGSDSLFAGSVDTTLTNPQLVSFWPPLIKIILILIVMIAAIYGLVYFIKKYLLRTGPMKSKGLIKLNETFFLGPKSKLHIVQVGKKYHLISENESNVQYLTEVDINEEDSE